MPCSLHRRSFRDPPAAWWTDGKEEKHNNLRILERDGTGDVREERNRLCEVASPTVLPKSQPVLPLCLLLWLCRGRPHITTRDPGDAPGLGSHLGPLGCPGAMQKSWPHQHWLRHSGELVPPLTLGSIQEGRPCTLPGQDSRDDPGRGGMGEPGSKASSRESWPRQPAVAVRWSGSG